MDVTGSGSRTGDPAQAGASAADPVVLVTRPVAPVPDLPEVLARSVQAGLAVVAVCAEVVSRSLGRPLTLTSGTHVQRSGPPDPVDVVLGAAWTLSRATGRTLSAAGGAAAPLAGWLAAPPVLPSAVHPATVVTALADSWRSRRPEAMAVLDDAVATGVPLGVTAVVDRVDLDRVTRVVVDRLDVDRLVERLVERIDVDRLLERVLARVDVDRLVRVVLQRLDLPALVDSVVAELDLDATTSQVLDRVEIGPVVDAVMGKIDLAAVISENLDLTTVVVEQVDLGVVIDQALDRMDLDQIILEKVDVLGLADYIVQGIDLPEMIRSSTGSVASEAVRSARLQGVDADRAVAGVVDRILLRRRARSTDAPGEPESLTQTSGTEPPAAPPPPDTRDRS